jgi:hypothetical protein
MPRAGGVAQTVQCLPGKQQSPEFKPYYHQIPKTNKDSHTFRKVNFKSKEGHFLEIFFPDKQF